MWQFWLIISGICLVAEIITTGFLIFWFAIGALITMIVSFFTDNIVIQSAVFVISSSILIFFTKPLVKKFFNSKDNVSTNAYSIVGEKAIVIEEINPKLNTGLIKVGTETWSAKTSDKNTISKDSEVEILSIDGVKAVVKSIV